VNRMSLSLNLLLVRTSSKMAVAGAMPPDIVFTDIENLFNRCFWLCATVMHIKYIWGKTRDRFQVFFSCCHNYKVSVFIKCE
jgi:hypothetical protein